MMDEKRVVEEIITKFLVNTCRLRPQLTGPAVEAVYRCAEVATGQAFDDAAVDFIPLTTGSVAEFYIDPMLPHIGDVDVMVHLSDELAMPRGHPPPTQLPDEFHNYVEVYEIIDSHLPGYVYLELRYLLAECVDDGKYNAVECDGEYHLSNRTIGFCKHNMEKHGPAAVIRNFGDNALPVDIVRCVRCLVWPPHAAEWPTRHRNYGWPDSATVDCVVRNGCDVVGAAHRQCRQHEWMGDFQWRLSFSRAEIVLLNSWMPVQQIVYHVLRVFMKTERLTESADNSEAGTLSNYHVKTLTLWACELKSQTWWSEVNVVRICVQLLHILAVWLTDARCQHYFINNCNLINSSFSVENIAGHLWSLDETWLSSWFVDRYIRKCCELCPENISYLFGDISTTRKLSDAVSAIVAWRHNNALLDMWLALDSAEICIARSVTQRSQACVTSEWTKVDSRLSVYFKAVAFLHVAYKSSRACLSDELMDILSTLLGETIPRRRYFTNSTSVLSLHQAAKLMKVVAHESRSTMSLIATELSKAYLYRALRCEDSDSNSIYCLSNVYLAVLYYTTGHYQTAIDHCTLVTRSQDHSQCSSHVVQGELLPKVDDDIDTALGFAMFYQYVRTVALNQPSKMQYVTVFTADLVAQYLSLIMSKEVAQATSNDKCQQCKNCISVSEQLFIGDLLLFQSLSQTLKQKCSKAVRQHCCQPTVNTMEHDTSDLVELLQKSAVEHLTTCRQIEARDFAPAATILTTDFEALCAYKRGDYRQCLQLSTQNISLHTLLNAVHMPSVPTFPEFIQLLDDGIVSLTALTLIVCPTYRDRNACASLTQVTLSLYLMTQCQLELHHSVTSLAQTLHCIKVAHRRHPVDATLNRLVLKMIAHKTLTYITTMMNKTYN